MIKRLASSPVTRNAAILYAVQISGYLVSLITVPYLARVLTPARFGLVAYAQDFIWYFVLLTDYSFNVTATRQAAIHQDDPPTLSRLFCAVMTAKVCLLGLGFILLSALLAAVPKFRQEWPLFLIVYMSVASYVAFPLWYFVGLQKMRYVGVRDILGKIVVLTAVFAFVHGPEDYRIAAALQAGGLLVTGLIGLAAAPLASPIRFVRPAFAEVRHLLLDGWPVFATLFIAGIGPSTNVVILGLAASSEQVGIFSAASRIIFPLRATVGPLVTALYPHMSRLARHDPERALRFLRRSAFLLSLPFLAVALGVALLGPAAVRLLYGALYSESAVLLQIMGVTPLLMSISHCFSTYYMLAFGLTRQWSRITFAGVAFNFLALPFFLWLVRPSMALPLTMVAADLFLLILFYWYYTTRTSPGHANGSSVDSPAGSTWSSGKSL